VDRDGIAFLSALVCRRVRINMLTNREIWWLIGSAPPGPGPSGSNWASSQPDGRLHFKVEGRWKAVLSGVTEEEIKKRT
jgi:hypothetical protein